MSAKNRRAITITLYSVGDEETTQFNFGDVINGYEVTGIANYDLMRTMEIAEDVLENPFNSDYTKAMNEIDSIISGTTT